MDTYCCVLHAFLWLPTRYCVLVLCFALLSTVTDRQQITRSRFMLASVALASLASLTPAIS
eukprot:1099587-Pelagomonas_calceolata.AAC.3